MKPYIYTFAAIICAFLLFAPKANAVSWSFSRSITVTSTASVASGTQTSFPMLVSSTLSSWKSTGNGGNVQNLVTAPNGGTEPADLVFSTSTANCTSGNYLNFETERYTSSTGELIDWVNVPSVSTGTVIYACYGASSVTTDQSHSSSTWDSNYKGVYHLPNGTILNASDSTSNANNVSSNVGAVVATGIVDGGLSMAGGQYMKIPSISIATNITMEIWASSTVMTTQQGFFIQKDPVNSEWGIFVESGSLIMRGGDTAHDLTCTAPSNNAWHHIVGTIAGTSGTIYIDGSSCVTGTATAINNGTANPANNLTIGSYGGLGNYNYTGFMDEARVSDAARSADWIKTEYNNQSSPSTFYTIGAETSFSTGGDGRGEGAILFLIKNAKMTVKNGKVTIDN